MTGGRPGKFDHERQARVTRQRKEKMTPPQELFHDVFRPAVQFIRSRYDQERDVNGRPIRRDYGLLKQRLPRMSQLKFEHWEQLRNQCRLESEIK